MNSEQKKISLQSTFDELERIEPFVNDLRDWLHFGDQLYNNIMLALSEAVTNAIVHGNKRDASKSVTVKAGIDNETLKISVKDEGKGFNPEKIPNPVKEENLMKEGGRGVFLIKKFADDIQFSEDGTKIVILFELG